MNTQNSFVSSVSSLFSKPTVADGSLKQRLWTTNANTACLTNVLTIETTAESIVYNFTTDKSTYSVSSDVLAARALYESFQGAGVPLDDLLGVMSQGYLNNAQKSAAVAAQDGKTKSSLSPTAHQNRVLTSEEYLANCVKLAEPDLLTFYNTPATDKSTKTELLAIIDALKSQLVTANQSAHYESIKLVEEQEKAKYQALTDIGFINISRLPSGLINTRISAADFADNAIVKLQKTGFKMQGNFSMPEPNIFSVQLVEGEPTI